jgi:hypothetical protein
VSTASSFICVYLGSPDECPNCGGSATLGGTQEPVETDRGRFCSDDCAADAEEMARRTRVSDWCQQCGYDRHEHAPTCSRARVAAETGEAT